MAHAFGFRAVHPAQSFWTPCLTVRANRHFVCVCVQMSASVFISSDSSPGQANHLVHKSRFQFLFQTVCQVDPSADLRTSLALDHLRASGSPQTPHRRALQCLKPAPTCSLTRHDTTPSFSLDCTSCILSKCVALIHCNLHLTIVSSSRQCLEPCFDIPLYNLSC